MASRNIVGVSPAGGWEGVLIPAMAKKDKTNTDLSPG